MWEYDPILAERAEQQQVLESFSDIVNWLNIKKQKQVSAQKLQEAINLLFAAITANEN